MNGKTENSKVNDKERDERVEVNQKSETPDPRWDW